MAEVKKLLTDQEYAMIDVFIKDPVVAAESILIYQGEPLRLLPYQRIVLRSLWEGKPNNLLIMGRGMAKSFMLAVYSILKLVLFPNQKIGIIGPSYRQSKLLFSIINEFYMESPYVRSAVVKEPTMGTTECSIEIRTNMGVGYIKALPIGDGNKIRGQRFNILLLDEFVHIPESIHQLVIEPMSIVKPKYGTNQTIIASTAYYQFNHLYKQYKIFLEEISKGNKNYNLQMFSYKDTPNLIDMEKLESARKSMPRDWFLMEYENVFPAEGDGVFPPSLVRGSQKESCPLEYSGVGGAEYVLGVDPATEDDNFALAVVKISGGSNKLVKVETVHKGTIQRLLDRIRWHCDNFNVIRLCMDQGGGGTALRDLLAEDYYILDKNNSRKDMEPILLRDMKDPKSYPSRRGRRILDLIYCSDKENTHMNTSFMAELENGAFVFPQRPVSGNEMEEILYEEIEKSIGEITMVKRTINSRGYFSYDVPSGKKDRYSAILLAARAAREVRGADGVEEEKKKLPSGFWTPKYF